MTLTKASMTFLLEMLISLGTNHGAEFARAHLAGQALDINSGHCVNIW